jgi:hypothetical protein
MIQKHVMLYNGEFCVRNTKQMCHLMILFHSFFMTKMESNMQFSVFRQEQTKIRFVIRETREQWLLQTQANGDSKSTKKRGLFLAVLLGLSCQYKRFLSCLGCSSRPSRKYFFLTVHYFNFFVPTAQLAGQAAVQGRLSLIMYLCFFHLSHWCLPSGKGIL